MNKTDQPIGFSTFGHMPVAVDLQHSGAVLLHLVLFNKHHRKYKNLNRCLTTSSTFFSTKSVLETIQVYLYSAFHDTNHCKAALQNVCFYIIFRSRLLVTEMYSKNHAVSYKPHVIKQMENNINWRDYVAIKLCD